MAYFIHNKYSSESNSKVTLSNGSYTYNADSSVTVIDYYGLLESGNTTYKMINTSSMGVSTIETLEYSDIVIGDDTTEFDKKSEFIFGKSIVINTIQRGIVQVTNNLASNAEMEIRINKIDMSKTILLSNKIVAGYSVQYAYNIQNIMVYLKNENTIGIKNLSTVPLNESYIATVEYQVIEYM